jgi:3-hydroxyisobutyrate dehydrogenase
VSVAFFGTGLLGAGFVRALLRRGETVRVYNRTLAKARALEADGALVFEDPAAAARGADRVHLSLSDDAAVDEVLARASLPSDAVIVDHTTTAATATRERAERWPAYVHAPVFMGPQHAHDATGMMLVSGARARVEAVRPHLEKMTGKVLDLGERPDAAAAFKLFGNLFLMFFTSGLAEVFTLARALDVEPRAAATLFEHFNPGLTIGARLDRMLGGDWSKASWELAMARKDARIMLEEASRAGRPLPMLEAIAARMDEMLERGHARSDWTVIAKDAIGDRGRVDPR